MKLLSALWLPGAVACLIILIHRLRQQKVPKGLQVVPGPKGWPVVGNTFQLNAPPQIQLKAWAKEYGDLFQIRLGWFNWIYVNDPAAVKEILDRQSAITSSRIPMPALLDLVSGGKRFLLMGYTTEWRTLRAFVHRLLTPKASEVFLPSQEFEAKQLVYDIYQDCLRKDETSFYMHVRRYTTSVVLTSTYGKRTPTWDCEEIREIYGLMKDFSEAATPGAYLVDLIPPLAEIIPKSLQWWRKSASKYLHRQEKLWMKLWTELQHAITAGAAPDCFVKQLVENDFRKHEINEMQAAFVAGSKFQSSLRPYTAGASADIITTAMIEAGSETTSSALNSAIKYLAAFPDAQATAHAEITKVVGDTRSPTFSDEPDLPYIRAMVKEILRLRPVANIGSPHFTTADLNYKGYFIPKGTVVSLNQYAIHYDDRYKEPESFIPDRYLGHNLKSGAYTGGANPYERDHFSFGAGRRICPGMHIAENSLFITMAKILWAFEIRAPLDPTGKEEFVDVSDSAYEDGANTLPKPFRIRFIPRNERRKEMILTEWETAREDGYYLGGVKVNASGVVNNQKTQC